MHIWYKVSKNHSLHSNDRTPRNDQAHGSCASTPIPNPIQNHPRSRNDTLCPWRSSAPTGDDTARSPSPWWTKKEHNAEGPKFLPSSPKDPPLPEVEGGRRPEEQRRRWYRIAGERNVVTFKLEWTTVCVEKEKERERGEGERGVASGRCRPRCVCVCGALAHTEDCGGSYSKQREAPKPSSRHAILSFHNDRVPSRLQPEFQYTRIFNEPSPVLRQPSIPYPRGLPLPPVSLSLFLLPLLLLLGFLLPLTCRNRTFLLWPTSFLRGSSEGENTENSFDTFGYASGSTFSYFPLARMARVGQGETRRGEFIAG